MSSDAVGMRLRDQHRLSRARDARDDTIAEWCFGQRQLDSTDQPDERRHRRALEIGMHDDDAVARDQLRHAARDLERDLPLVERARHRVANDLKPLEPLRLTSGELRQSNLLDVMDHLLREQLDRAQTSSAPCTLVGRITEDQRRDQVAGRCREAAAHVSRRLPTRRRHAEDR